MFSIQCSVITNFWKCADLSYLVQCILLNGFNIITPLLCTLCRPEWKFIKLVKSQFSFSNLSNFILSHVTFFDFQGIVKLITRINECIICIGSESSNGYVEDSSINSLENSLARARERHEFKDSSVLNFIERTVRSFTEDLKTNNLR